MHRVVSPPPSYVEHKIICLSSCLVQTPGTDSRPASDNLREFRSVVWSLTVQCFLNPQPYSQTYDLTDGRPE